MPETLLKIYQNLSNYWIASGLDHVVLVLKVISVILSIFFIVAIIILIIKIRKNIEKFLEMTTESVTEADLIKEQIEEKIQPILEKLERGNEESYKLAVIGADNVLDELLKRLGYPGENMGERLKQVEPNQLGNLDQVWEAHKVRNRIAHESDFRLTYNQAKQALEIYQRALDDLS